MAPITSPDIPLGAEWGYQIKWDGVRTLVRLDGEGGVEVFSKRIEPRNKLFPEIVQLLAPLRVGPCVLDGEIVYFDGKRPNFLRVRLGTNHRSADHPLLFVMFDILHDNGEDLRSLSFLERYSRLTAKFPEKHPQIFVTDLLTDGAALWEWVNEREWEGIISKRLSSVYQEGKGHQDWFKKRKELRIEAEAVGIKLKDGRVSSLVLRYEDRYIGHVSSGLDHKSKQILQQFMIDHPGVNPFKELTPGMSKASVAWLGAAFICRVAALEFTDSGLLRQPKLIGFGPSDG